VLGDDVRTRAFTGEVDKDTSDDDLENFAVCGGVWARFADATGSGASTSAAVPEPFERSERAATHLYAACYAADYS